MCNPLRNSLFSKVPFYFPTSCVWVFQSSHILTSICPFYCSHPNEYEIVFCNLSFFSCAYWPLCVSSITVHLDPLPTFKIELFASVLLRYKNYLYILQTSPLSDKWFASFLSCRVIFLLSWWCHLKHKCFSFWWYQV